MIKIYRGPSTNVLQRIHDEMKLNSTALLCEASKYSWEVFLTLFNHATIYRGQEFVNKVVAAHKAALSLIIPKLVEDLRPEERIIRRSLEANVLSHLTHNWYIQRPLVDALAAVLAKLLRKQNTIILPEVSRIDGASLAVLNALNHLYADHAPNLVFGYWTNIKIRELDRNGIKWEGDRTTREKAAFPLFLADEVEIIDVDGKVDSGEEKIISTFSKRGELVNQPNESRAHDILGSPGSLDANDCNFVIRTMKQAFGSFSFTQALKMGLAFLDREPQLSAEQRAIVHGIIGLSAHNRQFRSEGNMRLADFLMHHFEQALAVEQIPEMRCALNYRLAVAHGRRKKEFEKAMVYANQALQEIEQQSKSDDMNAYQRAWAHNIRAYLFAMTKEPAKSNADSMRAFNILDQLIARMKNSSTDFTTIWLKDVIKTQTVVVASLIQVLGDLEAVNYWEKKLGEFEERNPGLNKTQARNWAIFYRRNMELNTALDWALRGIKIAETQKDIFEESICTLAFAVDLYYRMGRAREACALIAKAQARRALLGNPSSLHDLGIAAVQIYLRGGLISQAKALLEEEVANGDVSITTCAEAKAMLAIIAAMQSDNLSAEAQINQAIELAVRSGERDTLLRVATLAGDCAQLLKREEVAAEAYERALEILQSWELTDKSSAPPAYLAMSILLGYQETYGYSSELVKQILSILPEALNTSESWWYLPRILSQWTSMPACTLAFLKDPTLEAPLRLLIKACSQRDDCTQLLEKFQCLLHDNTNANKFFS